MGTGNSGFFSNTNGGGCFTAGTLIMAEDGYTPIEQIRCGDYVYSKNIATGEKGLKRVVGAFVHLKDSLVEMSFGNAAISTTDAHPFWVKDFGWVCPPSLTQGDFLETIEGDTQRVMLLEHQRPESDIEVYNIEVEDWHTYYVSDLGVLVHNKATGPFKKPTSGTGKEKANDIPSWAEGQRPYVGENGDTFAKRLLNERYGVGKYKKRGQSEYSQLKKWGNRGFK
jgi:hypothetical protein